MKLIIGNIFQTQIRERRGCAKAREKERVVRTTVYAADDDDEYKSIIRIDLLLKTRVPAKDEYSPPLNVNIKSRAV
jgi:hypothetical protein